VKFEVARTHLAVAANYASAVRSRRQDYYIAFMKSLFAGTVHLVRKMFSSNLIGILSRFNNSISDESVAEMIIRHFEVVRILNNSSAGALIKRYPNYVNKYVTEYLVKDFSKKSRREILKYHHQYLIEHAVESFYERILQCRPVLWDELIDENRYAVSISFNHQWHSEGDLSLTLDKNDTPLYELSFTIVPGYIAGCAAAQALMIGRVQGRKGQADEIRSAMRACHRIMLPQLLMIAVQSIAKTLMIDTIGGVSNEEQLAKARNDSLEFFFDYDSFWETFSAKKNVAAIYEISVPFHEKPVEQIRTKYRNRARQKRRFKNHIAASVSATFAKEFLKTQPSQNTGPPHDRQQLPM